MGLNNDKISHIPPHFPLILKHYCAVSSQEKGLSIARVRRGALGKEMQRRVGVGWDARTHATHSLSRRQTKEGETTVKCGFCAEAAAVAVGGMDRGGTEDGRLG